MGSGRKGGETDREREKQAEFTFRREAFKHIAASNGAQLWHVLSGVYNQRLETPARAPLRVQVLAGGASPRQATSAKRSPQRHQIPRCRSRSQAAREQSQSRWPHPRHVLPSRRSCRVQLQREHSQAQYAPAAARHSHGPTPAPAAKAWSQCA
eukprot:1993781-Pleurochrysis_carterae.AAC.4